VIKTDAKRNTQYAIRKKDGNMRKVLATCKESLAMFKKHPKLAVPFIILGAANLMVIYVLYLAPSRPVSHVLAPPIRAFFGERFLHYPANFYLLPKLFNFGQIFIGAVLGVLMSAQAVGMIADIKLNQRPSALINFMRGIKRYVPLLAVWAAAVLLIGLASRVILKVFGGASGVGGLVVTGLSFILFVFIQIAFIYTVPSIVINNKKLLPAFSQNLGALRKLFLPTVTLVFMAAIWYLPIVILKTKPLFLANKFFPEAVLVVLIAGAVISVFIDLLITISTTILFINSVGHTVRKKSSE